MERSHRQSVWRTLWVMDGFVLLPTWHTRASMPPACTNEVNRARGWPLGPALVMRVGRTRISPHTHHRRLTASAASRFFIFGS